MDSHAEEITGKPGHIWPRDSCVILVGISHAACPQGHRFRAKSRNGS
jgi:hypothetical protein